MERLTIDEVIEHCNKTCDMTEKIANARGHKLESVESKQFWEHYQVRNWLKELKQYKDLEEQGLLLRLPCKVGDTVYEVQKLRKRIQSYTIISIHISKCSVLFGWEIKDSKGVYSNLNGFCDYAIGKTVFLTKEESEQKLKEMKVEE